MKILKNKILKNVIKLEICKYKILNSNSIYPSLFKCFVSQRSRFTSGMQVVPLCQLEETCTPQYAFIKHCQENSPFIFLLSSSLQTNSLLHQIPGGAHSGASKTPGVQKTQSSVKTCFVPLRWNKVQQDLKLDYLISFVDFSPPLTILVPAMVRSFSKLPFIQ